MSESISLFDLLNVSIGTPHESSVNFSALHALLLAVLKQLDIRGLKIQWRGSLPGEASLITSDRQLEGEDEKVDVEAQRDVPESDQQILSGTGQEGLGSDGSPVPDPDSAAILSRIQTCEGGVLEALELIKELQKQKDDLKEKIEELHQQSKAADSQTQTLAEVEKCCHRVDTLENAVSSLRETLQKYPEPEKLSQSLDFVQSAQFNAHFSKGPTTPVEPYSPNIRPPHTPPSSSPAAPFVSESVLNPLETADTSEASFDPPVQVKDEPDTTNDDVDSFEKVSSSAWYQEMMVAVNTTNKLQELVIQLEGRMLELEEQKIQLAQLNELINNNGSVRSNNMMAQLNQQKVLIEDLMSDRDKLDNLEEMVMTLTMKDRSSSSVPASESLDVESPAFDELKQHVLYLRKSLQILEENMKHLRDQQVQLEERCSDQNLQDQLDDLRAMIEDTILSETTPMSSSLQDRSEEQGVSEVTERSHQTSIPVNAGSELSLLQQQHEQLQDTVNGLIQQLNRVKVLQLEERQAARNIGLMKDVQRAVLQFQEDCEKLQETTRILHEDSGQKQGLIEELYAMMEELEVKMTNMQEQETKTEKPSPQVTVSHQQVDAVKEAEVQELPKKVVLQEDGWHEFFHRLSSEMETKVNRIEVDFLMLQLEKRWKTIEDKLENPEHDSACLIKRELFHCLSCDRPVLMQVPGPIVNTLPSSPAFPSNKSARPLNADQQQNKRLKPGTSRYNCWIGTPGRKRAAFQRSYNDMYKQIESMESAWRRQDNWDSTNQNPAGVQHEWTSELMDNQAVPRSCGGSHANTSGLQSTKLLTQTEADSVTQEIGIIGLDGHIYKDCLSIQALKNTETKLPTITTKDGMCKTKNKAKSSASHRRAMSLEVGQTTPVHQPPPSARSMQCSRSASSCSGRDWPVSALGCCTSQSSITQTSAAADSAADPQTDEPLNL